MRPLKPVDGNPSLSDDAIKRIADRKKVAQEEVHSPEMDQAVEAQADEPVEIEAETVVEAKKLAKKAGFEPVGSGVYKKAHDLWNMHKSSDGKYALVRLAAEPDVFPEDEVKEAPNPMEGKTASRHPVETSYKETLIATAGAETGLTDRYGITVKVGDVVSYTLGGEDVSGRVASYMGNGLNIQLEGQLDSGVPADFVSVNRQARKFAQEDPGHDSLIDDAHSIDMVKPRPNKDDKMAAKFAELFWSSYGAELADTVVRNPLPARTIEGLNKLATVDLSKIASRVSKTASWEALNEYAGQAKTSSVKDLIVSGLAIRQASVELNLPFNVAWECRDVISTLNKKAAKSLFDGLREAEALHPSDPVVALMVREAGWKNVKKACLAIQSFRDGSLDAMIKKAVDSSAKSYWQDYFGDYGNAWVRDIKRKVKADLSRAVLKKQGLDDAATKYWEEYFGDYGKNLVDNVDRAVTKTKSVTPEGRKASVDMPLPQPVQRIDIFANVIPLLDEQVGNNRVAMVVTPSGVHQVLIRRGSAQKRQSHESKAKAIEAYQKAVFAFCGL